MSKFSSGNNTPATNTKEEVANKEEEVNKGTVETSAPTVLPEDPPIVPEALKSLHEQSNDIAAELLKDPQQAMVTGISSTQHQVVGDATALALSTLSRLKEPYADGENQAMAGASMPDGYYSVVVSNIKGYKAKNHGGRFFFPADDLNEEQLKAIKKRVEVGTVWFEGKAEE